MEGGEQIKDTGCNQCKGKREERRGHKLVIVAVSVGSCGLHPTPPCKSCSELGHERLDPYSLNAEALFGKISGRDLDRSPENGLLQGITRLFP